MYYKILPRGTVALPVANIEDALDVGLTGFSFSNSGFIRAGIDSAKNEDLVTMCQNVVLSVVQNVYRSREY